MLYLDMEPDAVTHPHLAVVTGAFGFTGRYVARRLLEMGVSVRTLTNHPGRSDPFDGLVRAFPLDFSDPDGLRRSMEGANVLYNTYWTGSGAGGPPSTRRWKIPGFSTKPLPWQASGG